MATPPVRRRKRRSARPAKRADRIASALILAALVGIFLAVYLAGNSGETRSLAGAGTAWSGGKEVLPQKIDALVLAGTRTYGPGSRAGYVDGQAPFYVQYGFKAVLVADYAAKAGAMPEIVVDVYDLGERRNAFGLFEESVPPEEKRAQLGNGGYLGGNTAAFWKGPYYVRIAALTDGDRSAAVRSVAESVAQRIQDDVAGLSEFAAFPAPGLDSASLGFLKAAAFGLPYLNDAFVASYEAEGVPYRLFYAIRESDQKASEVVAAHAQYLKSSGRVMDFQRGAQEDVVWGEHPYVGVMLVVRRGALVAGSVRLADRAEAERVVREVLGRAAGSP